MGACKALAAALLTATTLGITACGEGVLLGGNHSGSNSSQQIVLPPVGATVSFSGSNVLVAPALPAAIPAMPPAFTGACAIVGNTSPCSFTANNTVEPASYARISVFFDATNIDLSQYSRMRFVGQFSGGQTAESGTCGPSPGPFGPPNDGYDVGLWDGAGGGFIYPSPMSVPASDHLPSTFDIDTPSSPQNLSIPLAGIPGGKGFLVQLVSFGITDNAPNCTILNLYWIQLVLMK